MPTCKLAQCRHGRREAAWAEERFLGDLQQSVPQKSRVHLRIIDLQRRLRARRARMIPLECRKWGCNKCPEGPARHLDASRQKLTPHCLAAIFDSQLPSPKLSHKMPPKLPLPHSRGHFLLFQNCPRGEGNCAAIERQKLSRGNFCLAASRCLSGPSGWGFKGCLASGPGNRPNSSVFALFLPFSPFSGGPEQHLENPENGGKRPFSSNLLKPPSLKPPFAALQFPIRDSFRTSRTRDSLPQPSARLSEEICLSEGSAGVSQRALRGSLRGLCGVPRNFPRIFGGSDPVGIIQKVFSPKGVPSIFDAFLTHFGTFLFSQ